MENTDLAESSHQPDLSQRGIALEKMITNLETRMKTMLEMNDKATQSYSQVVQANLAKPVNQPTGTEATTATTVEKTTISLLDEYVDRERRKCNLVIHNMPERTADNLTDRVISDVAAVTRLVEIGINIEGVEITKVIRLGGRGQNRQNKPRLILATM